MQNIFQLDEGIIHLNHAAVGPWPVATRHAICRFADENVRFGSRRYEHWLKTESRLRKQLQQLIAADDSDEIAILKNTSEGLSVVAQGLNWQAGDNIIIPAGEFPSNRIVWQALARQGVEIRIIDISDTALAEDNLIAAMDSNTRLLSCSSVQYASGLRLDLIKLGKACHHRRILFCVDAIQSLGAVGFDVNEVHADFVVADGHKWLCAPEGTALFYCRREHLEQLNLHQFGWRMVEKPLDFEQTEWQPASTAQRFECGSPNMMGIAALSCSLDVLLEVGMEKIESQVLANSRALFEQLNPIKRLAVLTCQEKNRYAGIVTFRCLDADNEALYNQLQANGVICALRGGGIRFSPHFHTRTEDMTLAIDYVKQFLVDTPR